MKRYYLISSEYDIKKREAILSTIKDKAIASYADFSNDEYNSFAFTEDEGREVYKKLMQKYHSSAAFFGDSYSEEDIKDMRLDKYITF